jgi:hypothetical protein
MMSMTCGERMKMEIDRTAQTPIVSALQQNRGEIDAETLGRMLASVAESQDVSAAFSRGLQEDSPQPS